MSSILEILEDSWEDIQYNNAGIPDVEILISDLSNWGESSPGRVTVAYNCLVVGATFAFDTLLHEAAHMYLANKGVRKYQKHGLSFQHAARKLGMTQYGSSSLVMLSKDTVKQYADNIKNLEEAIKGARIYKR